MLIESISTDLVPAQLETWRLWWREQSWQAKTLYIAAFTGATVATLRYLRSGPKPTKKPPSASAGPVLFALKTDARSSAASIFGTVLYAKQAHHLRRLSEEAEDEAEAAQVRRASLCVCPNPNQHPAAVPCHIAARHPRAMP